MEAHAVSEKGLLTSRWDDRDEGSLCALETLASMTLSSYMQQGPVPAVRAFNLRIPVHARLTHADQSHLI